MTKERHDVITTAYFSGRECTGALERLLHAANSVRLVLAINPQMLKQAKGFRVLPGKPPRLKLTAMSSAAAQKSLGAELERTADDLVRRYGGVVGTLWHLRRVPAEIFNAAEEAHSGGTTFDFWGVSASSALAAARDIAWVVLERSHAPALLELADPGRTPALRANLPVLVAKAFASDRFGGIESTLRDLTLSPEDLRRLEVGLEKERTRLLSTRSREGATPPKLPWLARVSAGAKRLWDRLDGGCASARALAHPDDLDTSPNTIRQWVSEIRRMSGDQALIRSRTGFGYYRPDKPPMWETLRPPPRRSRVRPT